MSPILWPFQGLIPCLVLLCPSCSSRLFWAAPLQAHRALKAWSRLQVAGEGVAIPWVGVMVIANQMRVDGSQEAMEIA